MIQPPKQGSSLRRDAPASIVVFLVALPLCLGVALASGAPLVSGLIAGIIGGLVVAPLSGSNLMVSGPAAGLTAVVALAIGKLGGFDAFLLALVIAGAMQLGVRPRPSRLHRRLLPVAGDQGDARGDRHHPRPQADPARARLRRRSRGRLRRSSQLDHENTFSAFGELLGRVEPAAVLISVVGAGAARALGTTRLEVR